ncbi:MAG: 5'/3'-nucleotidase SurE [Acidimicrobiales bacterium]
MRRQLVSLVLLVILALVASSCGDDGDTASTDAPTTTAGDTTTTAAETTTTTAAPDPLTILITNDDGVAAEGIDALVEMLRTVDGVEIVVVAPDGNRSGSSDSTTDDGSVTAAEATTLSGFPAIAVSGFPADAVIHALDVVGIVPDLVISGINDGANIGPFTDLSGTVGAARTAARAGYPALAASQGLGEPADFETGASLVEAWLADHIDELRAGTDPFVDSINIPTCVEGEVRGVVEVPVATDFADRDPLSSDCTSDATEPVDDVGAVTVGFASLAELTY